MATEPEEESRYLLGSRERRGLLAGWRAGQIASVATGLVLSVGMLRLFPSGVGLVLALVVTIAGVAGACWPVAGRTLDEWVPAVLRYAGLVASGSRRWRDRSPERGHAGSASGRMLAGGGVSPARAGRTGPARGTRPGCLTPITLEAVSPAGGGGRGDLLGVVHDRERGACTAVISVSGGGFALLGKDERRERVAAWSRLLAAIAREGSAVHRLQWLERCLPDDGSGLQAHFERSAPRHGGDGGGVAAARYSYGELLGAATRHAVRHELYVAVTVREPRVGGLGPRRSTSPATLEQLAVEAAALERGLRQAGTFVHGALDPQALRALLASPFEVDPAALEPVHSAGGTPAPPWPHAYDVEWDHFRAGAVRHASYWVAEWPRADVTDDFLVPLLTSGLVRRTFSVTLAPVAPLRASRQAEHARTSGVADAEVRRRHGFAVTARARQEHDAVLRREAELAAGHASYRFSGYLTVTAGDGDGLARACEATERLAAGCQLDLRRMYGAQDAGFLATLPVGRGLS